MKRTLCVLIFLILPLSCTNGLYDILDDLEREVPICVDPATGVDSGDGRGWDNAYQTITYAVDHAGDDDEIWVAKGNYDTQPIDINRRARLYGGFNGTESSRDVRDSSDRTIIEIDATPISILSSDILMEGFQITGMHSPSAVVLSLADHSVIFKNCSFVSNLSGGSNGSAISCEFGTVKLVDCSFTGNYTTSGGSFGGAIWCSGGTIIINGCSFDANRIQSGGHGGAIYCTGAGRLVISDTVFSGNYTNGTSDGGAIWCSGSSLTLTGCTFNGNYTSNGRGGAIYCEASSNIEIIDTTFTGNHTPTGGYSGGAIFSNNSTFTITGSTFDGNKANGGNGGAIYCEASSDLQINTTIFTNNTATGNYYGGAIYADSGSLTIDKCTFQSNTGPWGGGAIRSNNGNSLTITGTLFKSNTTNNYYGGAVYSVSSTLIVINSVFNSNNTGLTGSHGGAIYIQGTQDDIIVNSTFFNNGTGSWIGAVYSTATTNMYLYNCIFFQNKGTAVSAVGGGTVVAYNNAWDDGETCTGSVALTSSPFVSTTSGSEDFRLKTGSNCINKGFNIETGDIPGFTMLSADLADNPRVAGGIIDIGAYERQ